MAQLRAEVVAKGSGARWGEKDKLGAVVRLNVPAGPDWDDKKRAKRIADGLTKIKGNLRKEAEGSGDDCPAPPPIKMPDWRPSHGKLTSRPLADNEARASELHTPLLTPGHGGIPQSFLNTIPQNGSCATSVEVNTDHDCPAPVHLCLSRRTHCFPVAPIFTLVNCHRRRARSVPRSELCSDAYSGRARHPPPQMSAIRFHGGCVCVVTDW